MKLKLFVFLTFLTTVFGVSATVYTHQAGSPSGHDAVLNRTVLYAGPDSISKFYRIPGIVTLADGTICTVADRRINHNGDLAADIDVVFRKSMDGGRTWTDAVTVLKHDEGGGYGDPALGIDPKSGDLVVVCTHGNGLWTSTPDDHAYIIVTRSKDKGETWSAPVDITGSLFSPVKGEAPVECVTAFASSGLLSARKDGALQFVLVCRTPGEQNWGPLAVHYCWSDDGGYTWTASPNAADTYGDESKVVELKDGTILMSIRNRNQGNRKFARSKDKGVTWSEPEVCETLPDPAINGDIIAMKRPGGSEILLHSICDDPKVRTNVSLFASADAGKTWTKLTTLCPTGSAYSTLTITKEGTLGSLVEENSSMGGFRLWFTETDIEKLLKEHGM